VLGIGDRHRPIENLTRLALAIVKQCQDVAEGHTTHFFSTNSTTTLLTPRSRSED
jgi:hypothetical protein